MGDAKASTSRNLELHEFWKLGIPIQLSSSAFNNHDSWNYDCGRVQLDASALYLIRRRRGPWNNVTFQPEQTKHVTGRLLRAGVFTRGMLKACATQVDICRVPHHLKTI